MRKIIIDSNAVKCAATFLFGNNPHLNYSLQKWEDKILGYVKKVYETAMQDGELSYISTAGFTIMYLPDYETYGTIEVLVDPAIGRDRDYVNVENLLD